VCAALLRYWTVMEILSYGLIERACGMSRKGAAKPDLSSAQTLIWGRDYAGLCGCGRTIAVLLSVLYAFAERLERLLGLAEQFPGLRIGMPAPMHRAIRPLSLGRELPAQRQTRTFMRSHADVYPPLIGFYLRLRSSSARCS